MRRWPGKTAGSEEMQRKHTRGRKRDNEGKSQPGESAVPLVVQKSGEKAM